VSPDPKRKRTHFAKWTDRKIKKPPHGEDLRKRALWVGGVKVEGFPLTRRSGPRKAGRGVLRKKRGRFPVAPTPKFPQMEGEPRSYMKSKGGGMKGARVEKKGENFSCGRCEKFLGAFLRWQIFGCDRGKGC